MAFDAFIKIDGIPGECTDDKHKEWFELLSFSQGISQAASATASTSGGGSSERANLSPFQITKLVDKATPKIAEACCKGTHIKEIMIHLCRAGGDKMIYMEIKLEQSIISSVNLGGSSGGGFPTESISLSFGKVSWTYNVQKRADGTAGGTVKGGWDLTTNKPMA